MRNIAAPILLATSIQLLAAACASTQPVTVEFGDGKESLTIEGFSACSGDEPNTIQIDPDLPLAVFVHGCNASGGRFRALAEVFEAHGQQTICFDYDDRESMEETAARLTTALSALERHHRHREITVFGHSQGGLITRRAFTLKGMGRNVDGPEHVYRIVTVSSPFNGIEASSHCGLVGLHVVTLGITAGICAAIAGGKWNEIHGKAEFMREPGTVVETVDDYVKIVTDERETCRRYDDSGECVEDDFVFSVDEQYNETVDQDPRVTNLEIKAGHAAIVGGEDQPPDKLIELLQANDILAETPPEKRDEIAQLLRRLF
jgi:hypothetical protein